MPLRPFQLSLRFIFPLAVVLGLFALALLPVVDDLTRRWFLRDLATRSHMIAAAIREPTLDYLTLHDTDAMRRLLDRTVREGHLRALGVCDAADNLIYVSSDFPSQLNCESRVPEGLLTTQGPLEQDGVVLGKLLMFLVISALGAWIAHWSWLGWVSSLKNLLRRETASTLTNAPPEFRPLVGDLRAMLHEMNIERRAQQNSPQAWTPEKLRSLLHDELAGDEVLVVSNREPYIHEQSDRGILVRRPASGLLTAVEPVMRACSGT